MIHNQLTSTDFTKDKTKKVLKELKDLTMKDNFMFGAVMSNPENCKGLLERILHIKIEHIEIDIEKSMVYHPAFKGVRLDVYAKDDKNTHYNVEMQAVKQEALGKRSRYYHSQIDMELLKRGHTYHELLDSYVIFICDFDPFGEKKYCYTFHSVCKETQQAELNDGRTTIFLSTYGENEEETTEELVKFMKFIKADAEDCMQDFEDDYVNQLQKSIQSIKQDREMGERYMSIELHLEDERRRAKREGNLFGRVDALLNVLQARAMITEQIRQRIQNEATEEKIDFWIQLAATAATLEEFEEKIDLS